MKIKSYFIGFAGLVILFFIVFYSPLEGWLACETGWIICPPPSNPGQSTPQRGESNYVNIAGQTIKVDLALTPEAQEQGLSGRPSLSENEGMLFIFDRPEPHPFWMKDMNFSIDIIWIDEDKQVVYIKKDAKPADYPATYDAPVNSKYVLEVVSGFSDKNNLKEGDTIKFAY